MISRKVKGLIAIFAAAFQWLVDKLYGDQFFQYLRPFMPGWATSPPWEMIVSGIISYGPIAALILVGLYLFRTARTGSTAPNASMGNVAALDVVFTNRSEPYRWEAAAITHWRVGIENLSKSTEARNVTVRLVGASPGPIDPIWRNDFPYLVDRVHGASDGGCAINPGQQELFEVARSWWGGEAVRVYRLMTHGDLAPHAKLEIKDHEQWVLSYEVVSANAPVKTFSLQFRRKLQTLLVERL